VEYSPLHHRVVVPLEIGFNREYNFHLIRRHGRDFVMQMTTERGAEFFDQGDDIVAFVDVGIASDLNGILVQVIETDLE
jgi:hypothetical protein